MNRTIPDTIRELLLAFPETEETSSRDTPTFKVAGKTFAYFTLNHHGDGRAALWLGAPPGLQFECTRSDPDTYFVPPYVGPKGWLGMDLNRGLPWSEIIARVGEAWAHNAPAALAAQPPETIDVEPPDLEMSPQEINPMLGEHPGRILAQLAERCRCLPETSAENEHSSATWRAGKKVFVRGHHRDNRLKLLFWTGVEQQGLLLEDPRYSIPLYYGNNCWIELDVQEMAYWEEIDSLLEHSYRHFALKRMLRALDDRKNT